MLIIKKNFDIGLIEKYQKVINFFSKRLLTTLVT